MAKYTGPACKLCRREGEKTIFKGLSLLFSEVLLRETRVCSWSTWPHTPGSL